MKTKHLRVTMPDESKWDVPTEPIAKSYARYMHPDEQSSEFKRDYEYCVDDDQELKLWAENSMNWSDVAHLAVKVKEPDPVDYQEGWVNGDKEIIEKES